MWSNGAWVILQSAFPSSHCIKAAPIAVSWIWRAAFSSLTSPPTCCFSQLPLSLFPSCHPGCSFSGIFLGPSSSPLLCCSALGLFSSPLQVPLAPAAYLASPIWYQTGAVNLGEPIFAFPSIWIWPLHFLVARPPSPNLKAILLLLSLKPHF